MRKVIYMAHPVAPTEDELASARERHRLVHGNCGSDDWQAKSAVSANVQRALRWLSWLRRSFPEVTFIAPWIAGILSGEDDADPCQREAGLVDCCATVERCDGIAMVGGRIGSGGARERDHGITKCNEANESGPRMGNRYFGIYNLISLGAEPPAELCNLSEGGWHPNAFRKAGCDFEAERGLICLSRMGIG